MLPLFRLFWSCSLTCLIFKLTVATSQSSQDSETNEEVDIIFDFIKENIKISPNAGIELPEDKLPNDFDVCYVRFSERRTFSYTYEDAEQFTLKLSYEKIVNRPTAILRTRVRATATKRVRTMNQNLS
jgi:hypothetical protein